MATTKLHDFIETLQLAHTNGLMASVGIAPPLVSLLLDHLSAKEAEGTDLALIRPADLHSALRRAVDTDTEVTVKLSPDLAAYILNAAKRDIDVECLSQMRAYIKDQLPALNIRPLVGESEERTRAIDNICRAIDLGNDPTTTADDGAQ